MTSSLPRNLLLLICLGFTGYAPQSLAQREEANCGISAWVIDKDPNGLNVRDRPGASGKVIARLPRRNYEDTVTVYVVGYSSGWLKIGLAHAGNGEKLFDDLGWIAAKMVETGTKNFEEPPLLYAQPATSSRKIGAIPSEVHVQISGYACGFTKVSYQGKTGWLRDGNICGYRGNPNGICGK